MKSTRKVLILMLALMLVLGTIGAAHAYDFSTTISTYGETHDTKSKTITTVKSRWSITLSGSNLSSNNVFGARLRKKSGSNPSVSSYHTYTSNGTYSHSYYSDANLKEGNSVFLRYKKDDSSSYGEPLNISGSFEP